PPPLYPLSLHDALPISTEKGPRVGSTSRVADTSQAPVAEQRAREARMPQPRTPPDAASSAPSIAEPMGDIDLLLTEIKRSQVDRDRKSTRLNSSHDQIS